MSEKISFLRELFLRLFSKNPAFLGKVVAILATITTLCTAAVVFLELDLFTIPNQEKVIRILGYVIAFAGGGTLAAQAGTKKPKLQDEDTKTGVLQGSSQVDLIEAKSKPEVK